MINLMNFIDLHIDFVSSNPSCVHRHAAEVTLCNVKIHIDT